MKLWDHPLSENDLRQVLRIAVGATLGFTVCKIMGWSNGVFFTVTPMLLLGMVPVVTGHSARQLIAAGVVCAIEVQALYALFAYHPVLATIIAGLLFMSKFICMSKGSLYLFGANSVLSLSIMIHFGSYQSTDLNDLTLMCFMANALSVVIGYVVQALIPDVEPREPRPAPPAKMSHRTRHEALLGTGVAVVSFWVFQILNLQDSMSAQATSILLLFPMNWGGALVYARKRVFGTILGVTYGLGCQILLYSWSSELYFVVPLLWIGVLMLAYCHLKEAAGSGIGFGGMTTLGILFGQYLSPDGDLMFSAMYRINCILFGVIGTLILVYILHKILNSIPATQFGE